MGRDNKRHPNGTVPIEPRSSAKLLATWETKLLALLADLFLAYALGASEALGSKFSAALVFDPFAT